MQNKQTTLELKWILVTGALGFIGSHTSEAFLKIKQPIIGIDNFDPFYDKKLKLENLRLINETSIKYKTPFIFYEIDIRSLGSLREALNGKSIKQIIHLAAKAGVIPSVKDPDGYYETNVRGTLNILEICKENHIKELIFASSSSIYGNNSEETPSLEDHPTDYPISPYAATKKAGELLCHTYTHLYGMKIAALRFFTVYGARQRPDLAIYKFTKLISKGIQVPVYGNGLTSRDYTYISDIIDGLLKASQWIAMRKVNTFTPFNLGGATPITLINLIKLIESSLEKRANIKYLPLRNEDVYHTFADIIRAKEILGYDPKTSIKKGIPKFVHWFKEN